MSRARTLRALAALYVAAALSPLLTARFDRPCALGRFVVDDGPDGPIGGPPGLIELRGGILLLATGCAPAAMTVVQGSRDGTRLRTAWAPCGTDSRRVRARIDAACDVMSGVVHASTGARHFHARRIPTCGDGHRDAGEDCDDGNTLDGDCCTAHCELETSSACAP
jgi:cysteine-rich repeat protein